MLELQKAAMARPEFRESRLYVTEAYADWKTPFRKTLVTPKQMAAMADTQTPQGILAVVPLPDSPTARPGRRRCTCMRCRTPATWAPSAYPGLVRRFPLPAESGQRGPL